MIGSWRWGWASVAAACWVACGNPSHGDGSNGGGDETSAGGGGGASASTGSGGITTGGSAGVSSAGPTTGSTGTSGGDGGAGPTGGAASDGPTTGTGAPTGDSTGGAASGSTGAMDDGGLGESGRDASFDSGRGSTGDAGRATAGTTGAAGTTTSGGNADDGGAPGVRIVGRYAPAADGVRFDWSGVNLSARFTGTQISVGLNDGANQNQFEVVVDGNRLNKLVTVSGTTTYQVASGLANGTHDLLLWRRTEAYDNPTEFLGFTGFSAGGTLLAPAPGPNRVIEVVGDSISCGYGIENASCPDSASQRDVENNYLAYGSVAARALGADVVTVCWSGIGVYRNSNQAAPVSTDPTMPQRYDYAIPTDETAWDFGKYQPQAVVINLTTNDFSSHGDPGQPYVDAFVAFVRHIRTKYPNAYFFLLIEWSTSDDRVNQVVSAVKAAGDAKIESFSVEPYANSAGCQGHPDVAGSAAMGTALATEMKRVLGW